MTKPHLPQGDFEESRPHTPRSANESAFGAQAGEPGGHTSASSLGAGDLMNIAVRMVIPIRREFGRAMDVSYFLHDQTSARGILDLARSSRDARLRGYAAALDSVTLPAPVPTIQGLTESSASNPLPASAAPYDDTVFTLALIEAKRFASRRLTEMLGPTAAQLCLKIEAAHSIAEVIAAAQRAYAVLSDIRGPKLAAQFGNLVEAKLRALAQLDAHRPD